jgi:heavy metal sensor kinase
MNAQSLRFRMTGWYAGLLGAALLLFGTTVYLGLSRHLNRQINESLVGQARTIGQELLAYVSARGDQYAITEMNESYSPEINARFIRVTRQNGQVLYRSNNPHNGSFDASQIPPAKGADQGGFPPRFVNAAGGPVVLQGLTYVAPNGEHFLIETGAAYQLIADELRSIRLAFALGIPVFLLVAVAGGLILVKNSLHPIREITKQAERISSEHIGERLPVVHTGDEIERLAPSLNRMIERLEEAIQHVSRFSADVSHELRTPLTILQGELEAMAGQRPHDVESLEMIGNALEEIDRLSKIVNQLLIISRLDAGQAGIERLPVNLGDLALGAAEQMQLLADEKDIVMSYAIEPNIFVLGDHLRLKQVLVNLLDNAIKYTADGGRLEIGVSAEKEFARLTVSDNGIGIDREALPHIFERFYRADKARSRTSGGTGLGLSIVNSIATAHDGHVSVRSSEGGGTTVTVELPLLPQGQEQLSSKKEMTGAPISR